MGAMQWLKQGGILESEMRADIVLAQYCLSSPFLLSIKGAGARGIVLERLMLESNPRSEILAEGNPGADHRQVQEGSAACAGAAIADLQGAVTFETWSLAGRTTQDPRPKTTRSSVAPL